MTIKEAIQRINLPVNKNNRTVIEEILTKRLAELKPCIQECDDKKIDSSIVEDLRQEMHEIETALSFFSLPQNIQDAWTMYQVLRETAQKKFNSGQAELKDVCDPELYPWDFQGETLPVIHEMANDIESFL
jgi:hypothetical protein